MLDDACAYVDWINENVAWFFLKNFDLAKTILLSLKEIRRGIFEILACLLGFNESCLLSNFFGVLTLNCDVMHCLREFFHSY